MASDSSNEGTLGRIALKQVRVRRSDVASSNPGGARGESRRGGQPSKVADNPLNRLVPYLDLFCRLEDGELARLAAVDGEHVAQMRAQVDEVARSFARYEDLLDRLSEEEFVRLTQAPPKTVRFWLLCQPRHLLNPRASDSGTFDVPVSAGKSSAAPASPPTPPRPAPPPASSPDGDLSIDMEDDDEDDFDPSVSLIDDDDDDLF